MSNLNYINKRRLEKILEMEGGYVLDFSNRTFREFILECSNIDIYADKYSDIGNSKGKRLRSFWDKESNTVVGKLNLKLLEYGKDDKTLRDINITNKETELYNECIKISNNLLGIPNKEEKVKETSSQKRNLFDNQQLKLLKTYDSLFTATTSLDKRNRGYELEKLIENVFKLYNLQVEKPFRRNNGGEQIDGAFKFEGWYYLVESKWTEKLTDIRQLDSLYGKVNRGGKQTMGLFLSINGWSKHVVDLLKQNTDKSIILMDGMDLRYILDSLSNVDFKELLNKKLSALNYNSEPFYSVKTFITDIHN